MPSASPLISVMAATAIKAGRALRRDFGEVEALQVSRKGPADFVSNADIKSERLIRKELEKARPGWSFLMEEGGVIEGEVGRPRWIVDPLDGTTNFLHGLPHFAVSIGVEQGGELTAGVIYDPIKDETFWAEKGVGAYLNQRRIRVSARDKLPDALLATGIPFLGSKAKRHDRYLAEMRAAMESTSGVRRWGAAALDLAYVAAGRVDAYWEAGLSPWDIAAGIVLVREAGGYVSAIDGTPLRLDSDTILAANDRLFKPVGDMLRGA